MPNDQNDQNDQDDAPGPGEPAPDGSAEPVGGPATPGRPPIPIRLWATGTLLAVFGVTIVVNLIRALGDEGDRSWTTEAIFAVIWVALVAAFVRDVRRERLQSRPEPGADPPHSIDRDDA